MAVEESQPLTMTGIPVPPLPPVPHALGAAANAGEPQGEHRHGGPSSPDPLHPIQSAAMTAAPSTLTSLDRSIVFFLSMKRQHRLPTSALAPIRSFAPVKDR